MLCTEEGCKADAEFSYVWPWGTQGVCCGIHRVHLQQRAEQQLSTQLFFTILDPGKPQPVSRDERAGLRAKIMVLEEDVQSQNSLIAQHVSANSQQAEELRRQRGIITRLEGELREARDALELAEQDRDNARAECGNALRERDRLELMIRSYPADTSDTEPPTAAQG